MLASRKGSDICLLAQGLGEEEPNKPAFLLSAFVLSTIYTFSVVSLFCFSCLLAFRHLLPLILSLILRELWDFPSAHRCNFLQQCFSRARSVISIGLVIFPCTSLLFPASYFHTACSYLLLSLFLTYTWYPYFLGTTTRQLLESFCGSQTVV